MCGIFGLALKEDAPLNRTQFIALLKNLCIFSQSRGKESSGLHVHLPHQAQSYTIKTSQPASKFLKSHSFRSTLNASLESVYASRLNKIQSPLIAIAHSRMATNGGTDRHENNQPVRYQDIVLVHNGIIVNDDQIWSIKPYLTRHAVVDTEVLAALINEALKEAPDPLLATRQAFSTIKGSASIAWVHRAASTLTLATNTGDLYFTILPKNSGVIFASEPYILESALKASLPELKSSLPVIHLNAGTLSIFDVCSRNTISKANLSQDDSLQSMPITFGTVAAYREHKEDYLFPHVNVKIQEADETLLRYNEHAMRALKRCSRCILPETFPFITFDTQGICNYCQHYRPLSPQGKTAEAKMRFIRALEKYRRPKGTPEVLVPLSGGRDSCYGLHLIKNEFNLNPISFTYDWGMVTDLARRNIARICGQLGVQNILVSADIKKKRDNIRKNVLAWLKKPNLGLIPLFMAGDKHFFKILNGIKNQTGIQLNIWSANPLETTDFKTGYCGISPDFQKTRIDYLSMGRKLKLFLYYGRHFSTNTSYLNTSIFDTFQAFFSYYIEPRDDFYYLFHHVPCDESEINKTIIQHYDFECSPDSPSTWRIGDGTAPFYNYIYVTSRGFSEFDTFRSNQIREGYISRDQALNAVIEENRPRVTSLKWYLNAINLDFNTVIKQINTLDNYRFHT